MSSAGTLGVIAGVALGDVVVVIMALSWLGRA
jgi:hypothetical protein